MEVVRTTQNDVVVNMKTKLLDLKYLLILLIVIVIPSLVHAIDDNSNIAVWNGHYVKSFSQYPYIVSINFNDGSSIYDSHLCAGTFIARNYILTAGHCVTEETGGKVANPKDLVVYYGDVNLHDTDFYTIPIVAIYRHPNFISKKYGLPDNDLAILKVAPASDIDVKYVALVDSNTTSEIVADAPVKEIGWGFSKAFIPVSAQLLYGNQMLADDHSIKQYLDSLGQPYNANWYNSSNMIGTFAPNGERITQGDSGGPLLLSFYSPILGIQTIQIGITSWVPDVPINNTNASFYVRLSNPNYMLWINGIIGTVGSVAKLT